MGIIKNLIETKFTSLGANKVAADIEHLDRSQTRLGQSSASAGRQFAAQSQGLGGLVAAYAGAAATLFSVQAAFDALAKAAQAETVIRGTSALAAEIGQSGPRIIKTIQEITQGQLTMTEAAQNANIALSAGFNAQQVEQFAAIAQKASQALGRDFTDSLQRVVRGVSKLEPELLDELGIFTRIEPAVQKYAKQLGISATSLNEFQRRQAFANATIEEGTRKFSIIDTSTDSLQKTLEQLRVRISELGTGFLQVVGNTLAPFAKFLTGDIGNALLAFGFLLSLVFGKTTEVVNGFVDRTGAKLSGWSAGLADKAQIAATEVEKLRKAILAPVSVEKGAGLAGIQTKVKAGQDPAQAKRFAEALDLQRSSAQLVPSQLNAINRAYKEQIATLDRLGLNSSQTYKNINAAIERNNALLSTSGRRITLFIGLSNGLRASVSLLTGAFNLLGTAINFAFGIVAAIQLVGTLFDVDLLGKVVNAFKDLSNATKEAAGGFKGLATAFAGGGAALTAELKRLGASEEQITGFADRVAEARRKAEAPKSQATTIEILKSGGRLDAQSKAMFTLNKAMKEQQAIIDAGAGQGLFSYSQEDIEEARIQLLALQSAMEVYRQSADKTARVVAQVAQTSGLTAEQVAGVFTPELQNSTKALTILGMTIEQVNGQYSLENLTAQQREMIDVTALSRNTVKDFNAALEAGSVTVTSTGSTIAGLEANLIKLKTAYNGLSERASLGIAGESLQAEIAALEKQLSIYRAVEQSLVAIDKTYKDITTAFSKEISLFDTAEVSGLVNMYGQIATTQQQIDTNQAAYLQNVIASTAYSKSLVGDQAKIEQYLKNNNVTETERAQILATISKEAETYDKATAAVRGKLVDITKQAYELAKAYKEITKEAEAQIAELRQQEQLAPLQLKIDDLQIQQEAARAAASFKQSMLQNQIQLIELQVDNKKLKPLEGAEQINTIKDQILAAQKAAITEQFTISNQILDAEQALLLQETEIKQANIKAEADLQRSKITSDFEVLDSAASIYSAIASQLETSLVDGGNAIGSAIVSAINSAIDAFVGSFGTLGSMLGLGAKKASFAPVAAKGAEAIAGPVGRGSDAFTSAAIGMSESTMQLNTALTAAQSAADKATAAVTALEKEQLKASANSYLAERAAIEKKRELNRQAKEQEIALLLEQGRINEEEAQKRLREAADAGGGGGGKDTQAELTEIQKMLTQLFDSIKSNISDALMSLNNLVFYGEGNFGDIMGNLFKSIQQDLFKTTIADPLSDTLTEGIFSIFGIKGGKKGIENARVVNGALQVQVVSGPEELFGGLFKSKDEEQQDPTGGAFSGFFDKIGGFFSNLFGSDGIISRLFSGLFGQGGILSGLFGGILSLFGFGTTAAQGGLMHLAQGGAAISSTMRRDRVPAMLEPGEFVLRKQAVKSVGVPALQAMNATGKSTTGAPIINITNEGSPKDVQTAQPRFDGEKYVIDIVMRDFANNGPIRRSLRAKGGL